jgi:hypothetical protein
MADDKFEFTGKRILIISQQPWSKMQVSKHHYAQLLASLNNTVYFLESPKEDGPFSIRVTRLQDASGIQVVQYRTRFSQKIRFKFRILYDQLMRREVKKVIRKIGRVDIVWCFDPNIYADLGWFDSPLKIFHVVDPVIYPYQIQVGASADIILGVSERILQSFEGVSRPKYFINHGLSKYYAERARVRVVDKGGERKSNLKVGYIGNLTRGPVHHDIFYLLIKKYPEINFHFWGNDQLNAEHAESEINFIKFLRNSPNVILHGVVLPEELAEHIEIIDLFLLLYKFIPGESDLSNAHKILEYLSIGRHIVSSPVETYAGYNDIISMASSGSDNVEEIGILFGNAIDNIGYLNGEKLSKKRIELALQNTYEQQLSRISQSISDL